MDWRSSLTTRVLAASFLAIASTCTLIFAYFMKASRDQAVGQLEQRAAAFVSVADAARAHAATLYEDNVFRSEVLTDELRDIVRNGGDYRSSRIYETIPIVSGWTVARIAAAKEGIDFRITAVEARNADNDPTGDAESGGFRRQMLDDLTMQAESGAGETLSRINQ